MGERDDLFIAALTELKQDIRQIDNKMDNMHGILVQNTTVLVEHEKRSTSSEKRITLLEDKDQLRTEDWAKVKGFFIYSGIVLTALGSIGAVIHYIILMWTGK